MSACTINPCQNSGKCIPDNSVSGFSCECGAGSNGTLCEVSQQIQKINRNVMMFSVKLYNNTSYLIGKKSRYKLTKS